ncbi:hypothetical protein RJ641_005190 [Dillenia turbinata]|uniref:Uncharacterized protein n=1 Tax=Dillenia turbinata TaxID=194707 RepID=A0AAN8V7I5_9MAGN
MSMNFNKRKEGKTTWFESCLTFCLCNSGIGYAVAKEFLKAGDSVVICSRSVWILSCISVAVDLRTNPIIVGALGVVHLIPCQRWTIVTAAEHVEAAVQSLRGEFGELRVWDTKCDVREAQDVKNLVAFAQQNLKYIDIWVDNLKAVTHSFALSTVCPGSNAYSFKPLCYYKHHWFNDVLPRGEKAINMMLERPQGGHIFNIDGAGSDGIPTSRSMHYRPSMSAHVNTQGAWPVEVCGVIGENIASTSRFAAYGVTKCSVVHLTKSLQAELQMQDVKNVVVHNLSVQSSCCIMIYFSLRCITLNWSLKLPGCGCYSISCGIQSCISSSHDLVLMILQLGMVTTDLLMSGATTKQVAEFLVPWICSHKCNKEAHLYSVVESPFPDILCKLTYSVLSAIQFG